MLATPTLFAIQPPWWIDPVLLIDFIAAITFKRQARSETSELLMGLRSIKIITALGLAVLAVLWGAWRAHTLKHCQALPHANGTI
jgi:hypothetical protein